MTSKEYNKKETYSDIGEKKTSILGYLFLASLFVFLIIIGQTVYRDIERIPMRPVRPANCVSSYLGNLESVTRKPTCRFTEIDREFGIDDLIKSLEADLTLVIGYNGTISSHRQRISKNEREINELLRKYDVSLQEVMAGENAVLDRPEIKGRIRLLAADNEGLKKGIEELTAGRTPVISRMLPLVNELREAERKAMDRYRHISAFYNFHRFLLKLLFILPLFVLFLILYFRSKRKDSPYTIILIPVFFAVTILLLQIVLVFLYDILPKEWLARIFRFLMSIAALKYVIYYLSVALVVSLLGGVVYFIQRRVYAPRRVAARHIKKGKCPQCSLPIRLSEIYCPGCGLKIRENCPSCGRPKFTDLRYCPSCGHGE